MALNKIARKSSKFRVVFMVPDFCWPPPPAPPQVPPIPLPLFADLGGAQNVTEDVRINRKQAFVFNASKTNKTYGDEIALPGRKGVISRTATQPAWPMMHSSSVKIRQRYIVRAGDMFHMINAAGMEPQLLFRPRRHRLARRGLERTRQPTHHPRCGGLGLYRRSGAAVSATGSGRRR
ncbi:PAAR-like domain-containing protein [Neisseria animaloris]|uniref:PAAR-like domain-containing protein n=1 Tax=Neisseria animaloris TaxID=326522 RepID=UPI001F23319E|nr:PAAR-like domain-containing protein [Neisseria animaloris]